MREELQFLRSAKGNRVTSSKDFLLHVQHLMTIANLNGLSNEEIELILEVLFGMPIDTPTYGNLLLCMIPNDTVSSDIIDKIMLWLMTHYHSCEEKKILCLIQWLGGLLDFNLVNKDFVDRYYDFFYPMMEYFPKPVCHILYILTKPDDVQPWRILKCSKIIERLGNEGYLIALLSLFKKYKPNLVNKNIAPRENFTPFTCNTKLYNDLRSSLKNIANRHLMVDCSDQCKVTFSSHPKTMKLTWFPAIGCKNVNSGTDLLGSVMPLEVLHMLQSETGICALTFGDRNLKRRFYYKLYASLEQGFINKIKNVTDSEREDLLIKIIQLHKFCQQGLKPVSDFLSIYLKTWNGRSFKRHIYELIQWFVCSNLRELNRNLLWPLYMLFISSKPTEMCEILNCVTSLIINLYVIVERKNTERSTLFPDDAYDNPAGVISIIRSLTEFFKRLLKFGLINFPFDCGLLSLGITFYERMFFVERRYEMPYWTIIPPILIYESMFSCTAIHINRICGLLLSYNESIKNSAVYCTKQELALLDFYRNDIYNGFWASRILQKRDDGCMFYNLSRKVINKVSTMANLDAAFDVTNHVMFHPYRSQSSSFFTPEIKEELMDVLKSKTAPFLIDFIVSLNSNGEDNVDDCEMEN